MPIRIWSRANQVGPDGNLIPFFPPAPPPQQQPLNLHPTGVAGPQLPPQPLAPAPPQYPQAFAPHHAYLLHLASLLACAQFTSTPPPTALPAEPAELAPLAEDPAEPVELTPPALSAEHAGPVEAPPPAAPVAEKRQSSRLAALNNGKFVHSTDKAMQRTALKNSLQSCSSKLKTVIQKRNVLNRTKLPLSATDLRKIVSAAGLGPADASSSGAVSAEQE
ncbi:unnamed protein product [Urochloa humidicola]